MDQRVIDGKRLGEANRELQAIRAQRIAANRANRAAMQAEVATWREKEAEAKAVWRGARDARVRAEEASKGQMPTSRELELEAEIARIRAGG